MSICESLVHAGSMLTTTVSDLIRAGYKDNSQINQVVIKKVTDRPLKETVIVTRTIYSS